MKLQRLLIALTIVNLGLLVFLLAQVEVRFLGFRFLFRSAEVNSAGSVLRGRALEITDDEGRVRASIQVHLASVLPDGTTYPETVLFRLVSSQGRPNVKIAATEDGSALALGGESRLDPGRDSGKRDDHVLDVDQQGRAAAADQAVEVCRDLQVADEVWISLATTAHVAVWRIQALPMPIVAPRQGRSCSS